MLRRARSLRLSANPVEYFGRRLPGVGVQNVAERVLGTLERRSILFRETVIKQHFGDLKKFS